MTKYKL